MSVNIGSNDLDGEVTVARRTKAEPSNQTQVTVRADRVEVEQAHLAAKYRSVTLSELVRRLIWELSNEMPTLDSMPKPGRFKGARLTAERVHAAHEGDTFGTWEYCGHPCCLVVRRELELA
jgi:hypothetical protein